MTARPSGVSTSRQL